MLPKHLIAFLLSTITINAQSAVQKPPSVIITGPSSLNITHLLAHKDKVTDTDTDTDTETDTPSYQDQYQYQSQSVNHNTYQRGDTTFHSLAFSLQEEWQFALRGHYNLARLTADSSMNCLPGLIWVQGDQLYARLVTGSACEPQTRTFSLGTVEVGRWHVVSFLAKWGVEGDGELHLWVDGEKVLDEMGVETIMDHGGVFRFESCGLRRCLGL